MKLLDVCGDDAGHDPAARIPSDSHRQSVDLAAAWIIAARSCRRSAAVGATAARRRGGNWAPRSCVATRREPTAPEAACEVRPRLRTEPAAHSTSLTTPDTHIHTNQFENL